MLQILYLVAFAIISFLAINNLVRNLIMIGQDQRKPKRRVQRTLHPELIDERGNITDEPLLVIRSTSLEDARHRLDELYRESPDEGSDR
jgi:hypothetical protein